MDIHINLIMKNRIFQEGLAYCLSFFDDKIKIKTSEKQIYRVENLRQIDISKTIKDLDILIIDSAISDAIEIGQFFKQEFPQLKTIFIVPCYNEETIKYGLSQGVEGMISTNDGIEDLKDCIYTVFSGRMGYPAFSTNPSSSLRQADLEREYCNNRLTEGFGLTKRQTKVINLIDNGFSNKEIARELGIELSTVKNHVHQILERLNASSRCEAVALYRKSKQPIYLSLSS